MGGSGSVSQSNRLTDACAVPAQPHDRPCFRDRLCHRRRAHVGDHMTTGDSERKTRRSKMGTIVRNGRLQTPMGASGPAGRRCHGLRTHAWTARHGAGERAEPEPHAESSLRHTWHTHITNDLAPRHPLVVVASAQRSPAEGVSDDGNDKKNGVLYSSSAAEPPCET